MNLRTIEDDEFVLSSVNINGEFKEFDPFSSEDYPLDKITNKGEYINLFF